MTTAVLIDDHPVFRHGLRLLFAANRGPRILGEASHPAEALSLVAVAKPDIVLLDVVFPEGGSGVDVARQLLKRNPSQRILFLTMSKDPVHVSEAFEAGGLGYATKDQSASDLLEAVRAVAAGRRYVASTLKPEAGGRRAGAVDPPGRLEDLTARERQVFDLTVSGLTASAVGRALSISARTVETHRALILAKLGVRSATGLVRIAARAGVL